nr:nitroreductase family protein [uncultured Solibaculum sp.]
MEALQCITSRRTTRAFTEEVPSREMVEQLISYASWAPSWANSQCVRYVAVTDVALKNQMADRMEKGSLKNSKMTRQAPVVLVLLALPDKAGRLGDHVDPRSQGWKFFDCGGAAQTLCLAAHAMGLATVQMGNFDHKAIHELLMLPGDVEVVELIGLGYPDANPNPPARLSVNELLQWR